MNRRNPFILPLTMLLVGIALDSFAGSLTLSKSRTESLLAAAGFQILTKPLALQEVWYTRGTPDTLERHVAGSKVVYTFADQRGGFIYIGNEFDYRQYQRLLGEVSAAETRVEASEGRDSPWREWRWTWKPWKLVVWSYQP